MDGEDILLGMAGCALVVVYILLVLSAAALPLLLVFTLLKYIFS